MLEAIEAREAVTLRGAFVESQKREQAVFLGDSSFFAYARELTSCPNPLVSIDSDEARITDAGREVLSGRADHIELNGIDRWIGGVHLASGHIWRRDGSGVTQVFPDS